MSAAEWWIAAVVVAGVLLVGWRAQQRRTSVHDEWLRGVLLSDREVQQIVQRYQQEARARQEQTGD